MNSYQICLIYTVTNSTCEIGIVVVLGLSTENCFRGNLGLLHLGIPGE